MRLLTDRLATDYRPITDGIYRLSTDFRPMTYGMRHWLIVNQSIDGRLDVCKYIIAVRQHVLLFFFVVLRTAKQGSTAWTKATCGASVDRGEAEEE